MGFSKWACTGMLAGRAGARCEAGSPGCGGSSSDGMTARKRGAWEHLRFTAHGIPEKGRNTTAWYCLSLEVSESLG